MSPQDQKQFPDDIFRHQLGGIEDAYDPKAWEDMLAKLEADEKHPRVFIPFFFHFKSNHNLKTILFIMTTLSFITLLSLLIGGGTTHTALSAPAGAAISGSYDFSAPETIASTAGNNSIATDDATVTAGMNSNTIASSASTVESSDAGRLNTVKNAGTADDAVIEPTEPALQNTASDQVPGETHAAVKTVNTAAKVIKAAESIKDSALASTKAPVKTVSKAIIYKTWVPDRYEYEAIEKNGNIRQGWIGLHFTEQYSMMNTPWDSSKMLKRSQGFNIQLMSGNKLSSDHWAGYAGFDFGMQFYGRTPKSNVVINTVNQDSGFTRLHSNSLDFMFRAHLEYNKHKLVPYITGFAGPRFYSTGQQVASYLTLKDNESSTSNNVSLTAALMAGVGVGARLQISQTVSLDARWEITAGTRTKVVNTSGSKFNGLNYNLDKRDINSNFGQFKFGVIFNLSETEYTKKLVEPAHYETRTDSVIMEVSDTGKIFVKCKPCNCENNRTSEQSLEDTEQRIPEIIKTEPTRINTSGSSGSGSSGGSKGSFPGIKPPSGGGSRPSEKR